MRSEAVCALCGAIRSCKLRWKIEMQPEARSNGDTSACKGGAAHALVNHLKCRESESRRN